jgi:hypothetical protein
MRGKTNVLEMAPVTTERLTPGEFVKLDPTMVRSARIEPPVLGRPGFGTFLVTYRTPLYRYDVGSGSLRAKRGR